MLSIGIYTQKCKAQRAVALGTLITVQNEHKTPFIASTQNFLVVQCHHTLEHCLTGKISQTTQQFFLSINPEVIT